MPVTRAGDKVEVSITNEDLKLKSADFFKKAYETIAADEIKNPIKDKPKERLADLLANIIEYRTDTLKDFVIKETVKPDGFMQKLDAQIAEAGSARFAGKPDMVKLKENLQLLKRAINEAKDRIVAEETMGKQSMVDLRENSFVALSALMHNADSGRKI